VMVAVRMPCEQTAAGSTPPTPQPCRLQTAGGTPVRPWKRVESRSCPYNVADYVASSIA
jgi:hypothetical protein